MRSVQEPIPLIDSASPESDHAGYELSIVIPTLNERNNLLELRRRLDRALRGVAWQAIVVDDDSPDGTGVEAKAMARFDPRFSCLRRVGRRGLAGAVIEGAMASAAPYVAVLDADLQHDEQLLPDMLRLVRGGEADVVVASRFLRNADAEAGLSPLRRLGSRIANHLAGRLLNVTLTDPMSGFFLVRREVIDQAADRLSPRGFKILFDVLATCRGKLRVVELPYAFKPRLAGESKLDQRVTADFLGLLLAKSTKDLLSPRAFLFIAVGCSGLVVHLTVLRLALGLGFGPAEILAAVTAMTSNFLVNNFLTYRDRRLVGVQLLVGYTRFCLLCAVGLIANVAVANLLHGWMPVWWMAGVGGALVGAVWNYLSTSLAVW